MPYEGDPNAPTGPTQLGGGLSSSWYPLNAVQASGTDYTPRPHTAAAPPPAPGTPGSVGTPLAGGSLGPQGYDPGSIEYGEGGWLVATRRTFDPATGTYGYQSFNVGNPDTDPNFDWAAASNATGISMYILQADYNKSKINYQETQGAGRKLGNYSVVGLNDDGSMQVMKGDGTFATVSRGDIAAGRVPGVSVSDFDQTQSSWQTAKGNLNRGGQWQYAGMDPRTGTVTVRDGMNNLKTLSAQDLADPNLAGRYPGLDLSEVQRGIQQVNDQNFQSGTFSLPGTAGYQPGMYYSMNGAQAAATPNPGADPRYGGPPVGAPNPMPNGPGAQFGPQTGPGPGGEAPGYRAGMYGGGMATPPGTPSPLPPGVGPAIPGPGGMQTPPSGLPAPLPPGVGPGIPGGGGSPMQTPPGLPSQLPPGVGPGITPGGGSGPPRYSAGMFSSGSSLTQPQGGQTGAQLAGSQGDVGGGKSGGSQPFRFTASTTDAGSTPTTGDTSSPIGRPGYGTGTAPPPGAGMSNQQADNMARQAQTGRTLSALGKYTNITAGANGGYSGQDFYGNNNAYTKDQLINSGSATADQLYSAQAGYANDIRRTGQMLRAATSRYLAGYDPNQLHSTVAGM